MLAGGAATRIPRALVIREPYDSLSFVPTILALTNQLSPASISPARLDERPRPYPGRIINELFDPKHALPPQPPAMTATGAQVSGATAKTEVSP
jgi:hypothetical protein